MQNSQIVVWCQVSDCDPDDLQRRIDSQDIFETEECSGKSRGFTCNGDSDTLLVSVSVVGTRSKMSICWE